MSCNNGDTYINFHPPTLKEYKGAPLYIFVQGDYLPYNKTLYTGYDKQSSVTIKGTTVQTTTVVMHYYEPKKAEINVLGK